MKKKLKTFFSISAGLFTLTLGQAFADASDYPYQAPLYKDLGSHHHFISTKRLSAQRFFDQGLTLYYGFEWGESVRSFQEATRLDPNCGMCYWGLALALVSKMNAPMTGHEYQDAKQAIQKALALSAYEKPEEQAYIQALSLRFQAPAPKGAQSGVGCHIHGQQNKSSWNARVAYANAMQAVVKKYPGDADAKAIYAYAMFNVADWTFWWPNGEANQYTNDLISVLKAGLKQDPLNPGLNHYYVHVIEQSPQPGPRRALLNADRLRTLVPGSEHLIHMPAHIYFLVGQYHRASQSNAAAAAVYQLQERLCQEMGFKPLVNYLYFHNYDYLRSSAAMEGRQQEAMAAARAIQTHLPTAWVMRDRSLQLYIPVPFYVEARFGLWQDILNEPEPNAQFRYAVAMWHYARGLAYAHTQSVDKAQKESTRLKAIIQDGLGQAGGYVGKNGERLLNIADHVLDASIAEQQENQKAEMDNLLAAQQIQSTMGYHEPPDWYFPITEALGNANLHWGHPQEAVTWYQKDLAKYPKNGWALYGLMLSYQQLKQTKEAHHVATQYKKAWRYADYRLTPP